MITALILVSSLLLTFYLYMTRNFNYWKERGIAFVKPTPFIGNLKPIINLECSIGEFMQKVYNDYKNEPYVGVFLADTPCLVVRDYDLVCRIFKQDFYSFNNRIFTISQKTDPIGSKSLFALHGKEWKNTRTRISPIFQMKKLKVVFDAMLGLGEKFNKVLSENDEVDIKELCYGYSADSISDAVLNIDGKAMSDPKNDKMRSLGMKLFGDSLILNYKINARFLAPEIMDFFNISLFPHSAYKLMTETSKFILGKKENEQNRRGDIIDGLLDMREKGPWEGNNGEVIEPDDLTLTSQFFLFFTAGFDTSASGIMYCFYEIAKNPDIQKKLRAEIVEVLEMNDNEVTLESMNKMTYLSNFIDECMRKHPPFPFVDRVCMSDYQIPGTDLIINKGTKLMVPIMGLQNDEKYYENPDCIIPERFDDTEAMKHKPFFPFGMGPRLCLGMKFALLITKISIISSIRKYEFSLSDKTPQKLRMNPKRFGNTPNGKVLLKVKPIS